jgi:hypothetical protein
MTWAEKYHSEEVYYKVIRPRLRQSFTTALFTDFETKAADILGLYLKPPVNAAVFCVDEKSAIQALDRLDPVLPLSPRKSRATWF